jgi:translation elongation factor EF-G
MTGSALLSLALRPKTEVDRERLARGVTTLVAEDPTMSVHTNPATGEIVIAGWASCTLR